MPNRPVEHRRNPAIPAFDARPVRVWAIVDALATGPLLVPASALWFMDQIYQLDNLLGGQMQMPEFDGLQLFFVCLAGALGMLWALVRLLWPQAHLSLADSLGRLWVAGLISLFIIDHGLPSILWIFVLTESSGALHQGWYLLQQGSKRQPASA